MWRIAGTTGAVGFEIVLAIGIGYFGGMYLDRTFDTKPWLTALGFCAGIGAAIKALIRVTRSYNRTTAAEDERERDASSDDQPNSPHP